MMFDTSAQVLALKRIATDESHSKMAGINHIPALSLCCSCGKRRTSSTGKFKRSGAFVCNGCGRK